VERVQMTTIPLEPEATTYRNVSIGVDIGKTRDPTAVVVAEAIFREREDGKGTDDVFEVRDLTRLPIGTPYPMVADRLVDVVDRVRVQLAEDGARGNVWLILDSTGVGEPVSDEVRLALAGHQVMVTAAVLTGGERYSGHWGTPRMTVSKTWMVARLQVLLQTRRIKLPKTAMARSLASELAEFEIRDVGGSDVFGAFRTGAHDDLVVALGLATLEAPSAPRGIEWV
jgi:hypothetical protein